MNTVATFFNWLFVEKVGLYRRLTDITRPMSTSDVYS